MAENPSNDLVYWLELDIQHKDYLGQIRHWDNLKAATDEQYIWIKDFTNLQLESTELKSIPFCKLYYCKDNLLFPKGSLLPFRSMPNFLWTPIQRVLPVTLPGLNHNFFGLNQQQSVKLVPGGEEQKATALLADVKTANSYIVTAPAIRLQLLKWALINKNEAIIIGEPLLPINGKAFWQKGSFIFPVGYTLEYSILEKVIAGKIDEAGTGLIWWLDEENYFVLQQNMLQPLTIASWRQTLETGSVKM